MHVYALASVWELAAQKYTVPQSLPPGRAAWVWHNLEQSPFGRSLLGTLALRIQTSILAADLRARRRVWGFLGCGVFVLGFLFFFPGL